MRIIAMASIGLLALAGCDKGKVDETNASVEQVANAVAEAQPDMNFRPGRWETTAEFVSIDAPGLPPQAQEMMKKQMAVRGQKAATCLRPEDVKKPDNRFFGMVGKDCRFDHYRMGGGTLDAKMSCAPAGGPNTVAAMTGSYGPETYAMDVTSTVSGMGKPMTVRMKMNSRRVGECTGDEMTTDTPDNRTAA